VVQAVIQMGDNVRADLEIADGLSLACAIAYVAALLDPAGLGHAAAIELIKKWVREGKLTILGKVRDLNTDSWKYVKIEAYEFVPQENEFDDLDMSIEFKGLGGLSAEVFRGLSVAYHNVIVDGRQLKRLARWLRFKRLFENQFKRLVEKMAPLFVPAVDNAAPVATEERPDRPSPAPELNSSEPPEILVERRQRGPVAFRTAPRQIVQAPEPATRSEPPQLQAQAPAPTPAAEAASKSGASPPGAQSDESAVKIQALAQGAADSSPAAAVAEQPLDQVTDDALALSDADRLELDARREKERADRERDNAYRRERRKKAASDGRPSDALRTSVGGPSDTSPAAEPEAVTPPSVNATTAPAAMPPPAPDKAADGETAPGTPGAGAPTPVLSRKEQSAWLKTALVDNPPYEDESITSEEYGQRIADLGKPVGAIFEPSTIVARYYQLKLNDKQRRIPRKQLD
jgi:hypothetical protein